MKLLVIISGHEMNPINTIYIEMLNRYLLSNPSLKVIDYCGISNTDDFHNFENIISFKYKVINQKKQFSKICDFISDNKDKLDYDWYMKFRPDLLLLQPIDFSTLSDTAINARAREYIGPKKILYGSSIRGEGPWKNVDQITYDEHEKHVILDDALYIFHDNIIRMGAFDKLDFFGSHFEYYGPQIESSTSHIWMQRNIRLNVWGLYFCLTKHKGYSGHLNL